MVKLSVMFIFLLIFILVPFSSSAQDFAYNRLYEGSQPIDGFNYSINVNHSTFTDSWFTNIGLLTDVNSAQFDNIAGTLTIDESHFDLLYCQLTGCTMSGDIDMNDNSIIGADDINGSGDIMISGSQANQEVMVETSNPFGISRFDVANSLGESTSFAKLGPNIPAQIINGYKFGGNASGIVSFQSGENLFMLTSDNGSIIFGSAPGGDTAQSEFSIGIDTQLGALTFQGNKLIRPVMVDGGDAMVFQSLDVLDAGGFPFVWVAQDSNNETIITSWHQNGANNSFGGDMNSRGLVPKEWVTFMGDPLGNESEGVEFLFNVSNYLQYCDWVVDNQSLSSTKCEYFADTSGRGLPLFHTGDLEVFLTQTTHGGALFYEDLDFIGNSGNDVDLLFNGGLENGKFHIRDNRQIEANITFFQQVVTNFDGGTIFPFVSESIAPEVGRDWDSVAESQCHEDRCGNAKGGNEKVMAFSASTQFEDGTVASNNSRLMFWITSVLSGGDLFEVELDDNEGNVSVIYSTAVVLVDQFINVSFGAEFENKSNVTSRFILNGQNANREVWIDIIEVTSEPAEPIIINETFNGGKMTFGSDSNTLRECYIEKDRFIPNGSTSTEDVMNIVCSNVNIVGNVTSTSVTEVDINVTNDVTIGGNLTVGGSITLNDTTINNWDDIVSNVSINYGANESNITGPSIPFLLTDVGILKIEAVEASSSSIWEQVVSEIRNTVGSILNVTGSIISSGDITTGDRFYLPNGASVGGNSTCAFIFYNQTDSIIETKGCP